MMMKRSDKRVLYVPTPDEIRKACERLRLKWSEIDETRRRGGHFDEAKDADDVDLEELDGPTEAGSTRTY